VDSQPPILKNNEEREERYKGREIKIDEHEKVVDVFVRLVLFQSAVTPHVYKGWMDFPCKMEGLIHVQNPSLSPIRMAWTELSKTVRFKTGSTLRGNFEAVNDLKSKYCKQQSCSSRKNEELSC
jgi:hypothetical protein